MIQDPEEELTQDTKGDDVRYQGESGELVIELCNANCFVSLCIIISIELIHEQYYRPKYYFRKTIL